MKISKKIISAVMSMVIIIGTVAVGGNGLSEMLNLIDITASAENAGYKVGDCIYYGTYPQTEVTDSATVAELENCSGEWISYGYYSGNGNANAWMKQSDYMRYKDVSLNGEKYRAVTFDTYRPFETSCQSDTSTEISSQCDYGYTCGNVYWFKYEPVEWRVLDPDTGLVICNMVMDSQAFNDVVFDYHDGEAEVPYEGFIFGQCATDYAYSTIRKWLNNKFYNTVFSADEKSNILKTYLETSSISLSDYNAGSVTDRVFLLSYEDITNSSYGLCYDTGTECTFEKLKPTDYAKSQGVCASYSEKSGGNTRYWLRTPYDKEYVCNVREDGSISRYCETYSTNVGVAPAMRLQILKSDTTGSEIGAAENPTVKSADIIKGKPAGGTATYNYLSTVRFSVDVPVGGYAEWYLNDELHSESRKCSCSYMKESYTVKVVVTDVDGTKTADTEYIKIKTGLFNKIIAYITLYFNETAYTYEQK